MQIGVACGSRASILANSALIDQINDIKLEDEAEDVIVAEHDDGQPLPATVVVMDEQPTNAPATTHQEVQCEANFSKLSEQQ